MGSRAAVAGLALAAAAWVGCWAIGVANPPASPAHQGDTLGMQRGEDAAAYQLRAAESLKEAGDAPAFALVTFTHPVTAARAAGVVEGIDRVSGVVEKQKPLTAIPEPAGGLAREDVFANAAHGPIAGLVVWAPGAQLREVAGRDEVRAVEVLPPDAVWGAFAVASPD